MSLESQQYLIRIVQGRLWTWPKNKKWYFRFPDFPVQHAKDYQKKNKQKKTTGCRFRTNTKISEHR